MYLLSCINSVREITAPFKVYEGNVMAAPFKNSFCFLSQPHLVILQVSTTVYNITWRRLKLAILPRACLIVFYLVVEVTGFSQTVYGEKTLPHSTSQAWRDTHPDKSLNLKTQQVCEGRQDVCLHLLHGKTIRKIIRKTLGLGFFCSRDQSHLALADKAGSIPVAEQLTQLFHPHWAHFRVADTQDNIVGLDWFLSFWKSGWWWYFQWKQNWSLTFALHLQRDHKWLLKRWVVLSLLVHDSVFWVFMNRILLVLNHMWLLRPIQCVLCVFGGGGYTLTSKHIFHVSIFIPNLLFGHQMVEVNVKGKPGN